ncbi:MAG: cytochrome P450 [Pseudomonadota bacterium]
MTALFTPRGTSTLPVPDLSHLPGPAAPPVVGHSLALVRDPARLLAETAATHGPVFRLHTLGRWRVYALGADALAWSLLNHDGILSSEHGWEVLHDIFSGGLMLSDGDDHRTDRRRMQAAFRAEAMRGYLSIMTATIPGRLNAWPLDRTIRIYPRIKQLTFDLGSRVFMGLGPGPDSAAMNTAFQAEVAAALAIVRRPLPMTRLRRGIAARQRLRDRFTALIAERRRNGGSDFFSQMALAGGETQGWSDAEIIDQFNFLMMAAHDTTATTLTAMIWALAHHPDWQERVREELARLPETGLERPEQIEAVPLTLRVMDEALRLRPPVPLIPRRLIKDAELGSHHLPMGTSVIVCPGMVMRDPGIWTDPESFDPDRFSETRAEHRRHRFAHAPFGGGAHKCTGMHFARLQVVAVLQALLRRCRLRPECAKDAPWLQVPIPRPRDGLPIRLEAA